MCVCVCVEDRTWKIAYVHTQGPSHGLCMFGRVCVVCDCVYVCECVCVCRSGLRLSSVSPLNIVALCTHTHTHTRLHSKAIFHSYDISQCCYIPLLKCIFTFVSYIYIYINEALYITLAVSNI